MLILRSYIILLIVLLLCNTAVIAQSPVWVNTLAGAGNADVHACTIAPNGDVYVGGSFTGSMDIDPGATVYTLSSKGASDIFLACYNAGGALRWGISIGGTADDIVQNIATDKSNNAIIVGKFRGSNVDFDASGATKYLHSSGSCDGYVAKYTSNGTYVWAHALGGNTDFDDAQSVATDNSGNVYVGGNFHGSMNIATNVGGNTFLNSTDGTGFLVKYSSGGQLVWGFSLGGGGLLGVDNTVWALEVDNANTGVYLAGCYQGSNADFDPSQTVNTKLATQGPQDAYIAKYSLNGDFVFVTDIKGDAIEQVLDLALDNNGDIYVTGYTGSKTLDFSPTVNMAAPGGGGNEDIFVARYSNSGKYVWGKLAGSKESDLGWGIAIANNSIYTTGYYRTKVDFDPSAGVEQLASKGQNDIYLAKYQLNGNFVCAFSIGEQQNDNGRKIAADKAGNIYLCGFYSGVGVDFNPYPNMDLYKTSAGGTDGFLAKYDWRNGLILPDGYFVGDTVCEGSPAYLTFIATQGEGPYMITYSDGTTSYTNFGVENGAMILIPNNPQTNTTYILTAIKGSGLCAPFGNPNSNVSVVVRPRPVVNAGNDTLVCPAATIQLHGQTTYAPLWYPATNLSATNVLEPMVTVYDRVRYGLVATNEYGCSDTDEVIISLVPADFKAKEQVFVCIGDTVNLQAEGGDTYLWSPVDSLFPEYSATPMAWPLTNKSYFVTINDTVCDRSATLPVQLIVNPLPNVKVVNAIDVDCGVETGMLAAGGAVSYTWLPIETLADPNGQVTKASPAVETMYIVTGTDANGCSNKDSATIKVFEGNGRLFAPTAFTPNGDGKNDCYKVMIPGDVSSFELTIANRWGQLVYRSHDFSSCWNGLFKGQDLPIGTYYYFYKAKSSICNDLFGKGEIQLIR